MLINKDEIARKVLSGEIASMEDLNGVLRSMIKDVVGTALGAELTDFLGYEKNRTATSGMDNRRNGYSLLRLFERNFREGWLVRPWTPIPRRRRNRTATVPIPRFAFAGRKKPSSAELCTEEGIWEGV